MKKAIVILSGGMDSTTLLYRVISEGYETHAISFDYKQKHSLELEYAQKTCAKLGVNHKVVNLEVLNDLAPSALTRDDWEVPYGHYEAPNMKQTVVNNRNPIMANLALSYALTIEASKIFLGIHAGDHFIYEDCREQVLIALNETAYVWSSDGRGTLTPSWIASFFEAEGCFTSNNVSQIMYHRKTRVRLGVMKPKRIPVVIITQKDKPLLDEIKKFFYGRGHVYMNPKGIGEFRLGTQDCRLMIDLLKIYGFKTSYKREQFEKWYAQFEGMFNREVHHDNPAMRDKTYAIQKVTFEAPFLFKDKGDIVMEGKKLNVDYSLTHTCYEGTRPPCNKCGADQERAEAFAKAGIKDPLVGVLDDSYGVKCSRCGATFYQSNPLDSNTQCGAC